VELSATSSESIPVTVEHVASRGAIVRVELAVSDAAHVIEADLTHARLLELALVKGQQVFARPTTLRVFEGQQAAE
jgi:ABC-type sulfate/molybdate transport systems ATPase subunit